jgi:hypothetical protein
LAETPEEANTLRKQIAAVQRLIAKRQEAFKNAWQGGKAYCEASAKAGEEWGRIRPEHGPGRGKKTGNSPSFSDVGFSDSKDATVCVRIGGEMDRQDRDIYYNECLGNEKVPTLDGLYSVWKEHFGEGDPNRPWLRLFQIWNFMQPDAAFGQDHPGRIPGQIIQNLNYYYTKPGDLVVDLFAGGGSTIDVCRAADDDYGRRKCEAFDIEPRRRDIKQWDVVKSGLPPFEPARLLFLDPPYWRQKRGEYSDHETNLANMSLVMFHDELEKVIVAGLGRADLVALIIGPTQESWEIIDHAVEMMRRVGMPWKRIQVPYSTQQHGGNYVRIAKEAKQWLYLARDLMLWKA